LGDAQIGLTREKSQYAALNRAFMKTTEELTQAQVQLPFPPLSLLFKGEVVNIK
jgi:hypothetical protein